MKVTLQVVQSVSTCSAGWATDTWSAWAVAFVAVYRTGQPDSTGLADRVVLPSYAAAAAAVVVDAVYRIRKQKQVGVLVCSSQDR